MKGKTNPSVVARLKRKKRIFYRIRGTEARPRMNVYRSNKHVYAQVIDDTTGKTLVCASTLTPNLLTGEEKGLKEKGKRVGIEIARLCKEKGIKAVVFDRNGFIYQKGGRIDAIAAGAREGGLDV